MSKLENDDRRGFAIFYFYYYKGSDRWYYKLNIEKDIITGFEELQQPVLTKNNFINLRWERKIIDILLYRGAKLSEHWSYTKKILPRPLGFDCSKHDDAH